MPKYSRPEAVRLLKNLDVQGGVARFTMGDIALDQCPMGTDGAHNGSRAELEGLADEAGLTYDALYSYRFVSYRTPPVIRVTGVAWSAYREIALAVNDPAERTRIHDRLRTEDADTISGRWTVNAVRGLIGRKPIVHTQSEPVIERVAEASPEVQADIWETLEADPAVRSVLEQRAETKRAERAKAKTEVLKTDSIARKLDAMQARTTMERLMDTFIRDMAVVVPRVDLPDPQNDPWATAYFLKGRIEAIRTILDQVTDLMATGRVGGGVDAFFAKVLAESREGGATA